jgi:hypothetical protein
MTLSDTIKKEKRITKAFKKVSDWNVYESKLFREPFVVRIRGEFSRDEIINSSGYNSFAIRLNRENRTATSICEVKTSGFPKTTKVSLYLREIGTMDGELRGPRP